MPLLFTCSACLVERQEKINKKYFTFGEETKVFSEITTKLCFFFGNKSPKKALECKNHAILLILCFFIYTAAVPATIKG
jgi:hypothetical protein